MDAEAAAARALDDLANAEEEIQALEDLLRAHETAVCFPMMYVIALTVTSQVCI